MKTKKILLLSAMLIVVIGFFTYTEASAACSSTQVETGECVDLGTVTLQVVRTVTGEFPFKAKCQLGTNTPVACSVFAYYLSSGTGNNQINFLIPKGFIPVAWGSQGGNIITGNSSTSINKLSNCSQLITDSSGDPTTGFGKDIKTFDTCRVAPSANASFPGVTLSGPFNIYIVTLPALTALNAMQMKAGSSTFMDFILSAGNEPPQISSTSETFTSGEGKTVTVNTDQSGNLISHNGILEIPQANTRFCWVTDGHPAAATEFPLDATWDCIQINFATNKAQIKSPGEDPWVYIGGTWILY